MGKIKSKMKKDNFLLKLVYFYLGLFIASLIYNSILVPNNIVIGGVSGLAIIVKEITGLSTTLFIDIANAVLIIISFIFLGKKKTLKQLLGCISYPLMVTLTTPLGKLINTAFAPKLIVLVFASVIYGFANGIIYRAGYSTGGFDIITEILSVKLKKAITQISPILNATVIIVGGIIFTPVQIMYAVMIIFISNRVTNGVLFSISTSKMVYVISKKNKTIEDYIMNDIHTGATEIRVHSGLFERKKQMLMCILHRTQYEKFKHDILALDPNAFILSMNCYEVNGGIRFQVLPF